MGRINVELEENLHNNLRLKSSNSKVAIKYLVIKALEDKYGDYDEKFEFDENGEVVEVTDTEQTAGA